MTHIIWRLTQADRTSFFPKNIFPQIYVYIKNRLWTSAWQDFVQKQIIISFWFWYLTRELIQQQWIHMILSPQHQTTCLNKLDSKTTTQITFSCFTSVLKISINSWLSKINEFATGSLLNTQTNDTQSKNNHERNT